MDRDILTVVPSSMKNFYESQLYVLNKFVPFVDLQREDIESLKQRVKIEEEKKNDIKSEPSPDLSQGIFGDDDYYQLPTQLPTTSNSDTKEVKKKRGRKPKQTKNEIVVSKKVKNRLKMNLLTK